MTKPAETISAIEAPWLRESALSEVFVALQKGGFDARVVGGAVRNALSDRKITDVDLATPARPNDVMQLTQAAGLSAYPTGIDHGTVTVVADGRPFEVTTLRRDIETDGRRAVVAFTDDWREDSLRRDFTINALYLDQAGNIHDFHGGIDDLARGRVRFIGDAHARIREDYLRILRFFRFTADYANGVADADGLAACRDLKSGIAQLSAERIGSEILKLMSTPKPAATCTIMEDSGIAHEIFGRATTPQHLSHLQDIEAEQNLTADPLLRLAVLTLKAGDDPAPLSKRLRLSNTDASALRSTTMVDAESSNAWNEINVKAAIYRIGAIAFRRAALARWAASGDAPNDAARAAVLRLIERWNPPKMPVSGADVVALGIAPGPQVGAILSALEDWWIEEDFPLESYRIRERLDALAKRSKSVS